MGKEGKRHYALLKDFNIFMYDHTLHHGKKHFCRHFFQAFSAEEILKLHTKDWFQTDGKERVIMSKTSKYVQFENYEKKMKSPFIIYADFEIILVPENNGNQNPEKSYAKKY